jgi:hypothetical protein
LLTDHIKDPVANDNNQSQGSGGGDEEAEEPKDKDSETSDGDDGANNPQTNGDNMYGSVSWDRILAAADHINNEDWGNGVDHRIEEGAQDGFSEAEVLGGQ